MNKFLDFSALDHFLLEQYQSAFNAAFPEVIHRSEIGNTYWDQVQEYFPHYQRILVAPRGDLIGFMNTLPICLDIPLEDLPDDGWDWLIQKGIHDYEAGLTPNCLGGLQVIVSRKYLGKGFSKILIAEGKRVQENMGFHNFIIPIRPTYKYKHPHVKMEEYMLMKIDGRIYDPWIRTHVNSGAKIIKVCSNAMNIKGDVQFWEDLMGKKIQHSGYYQVDGVLNPVLIDIEKNVGEYREENIWIKY